MEFIKFIEFKFIDRTNLEISWYIFVLIINYYASSFRKARRLLLVTHLVELNDLKREEGKIYNHRLMTVAKRKPFIANREIVEARGWLGLSGRSWRRLRKRIARDIWLLGQFVSSVLDTKAAKFVTSFQPFRTERAIIRGTFDKRHSKIFSLESLIVEKGHQDIFTLFLGIILPFSWFNSIQFETVSLILWVRNYKLAKWPGRNSQRQGNGFSFNFGWILINVRAIASFSQRPTSSQDIPLLTELDNLWKLTSNRQYLRKLFSRYPLFLACLSCIEKDKKKGGKEKTDCFW